MARFYVKQLADDPPTIFVHDRDDSDHWFYITRDRGDADRMAALLNDAASISHSIGSAQKLRDIGRDHL